MRNDISAHFISDLHITYHPSSLSMFIVSGLSGDAQPRQGNGTSDATAGYSTLAGWRIVVILFGALIAMVIGSACYLV
jgi:hypothetical protein